MIPFDLDKLIGGEMGDRGVGVQPPWLRKDGCWLWSIPAVHPNSGHTPDISVKAIVRTLLRQDVKFDSWSLPNWRKEGVHIGHLASWGSLQFLCWYLTADALHLLQEPMPWMPGLTASRNSRLVHSIHTVFPEHSWALFLPSFISHPVCSLLPHSCGFPILLSSPWDPTKDFLILLQKLTCCSVVSGLLLGPTTHPSTHPICPPIRSFDFCQFSPRAWRTKALLL